jgi:hypothetical protein
MLERHALHELLRLRLLIARAAQKDSLSWWEDESLTQAGNFLMERLFTMDTTETARKLAMEAAKTRYRMAFGENGAKLHLFQLDQRGQVEYELRDLRYSELKISVEPITSPDMLRQELLAITGTPMPYEIVGPGINNQLEIRMKDILRKTPILELAKTLAWACLESSRGKPVFPYIQWT